MVGAWYLNLKNYVRKKKKANVTILISDKVDTIVPSFVCDIPQLETSKMSQYVNGQANASSIHSME